MERSQGLALSGLNCTVGMTPKSQSYALRSQMEDHPVLSQRLRLRYNASKSD